MQVTGVRVEEAEDSVTWRKWTLSVFLKGNTESKRR